MDYQVKITLTRQDYLEYNYFHSLRSEAGKKTIRNARIWMGVLLAILAFLVALNLGATTFTLIYLLALAVFAVVYILVLPRSVKKNLTKQVEKMEKAGKLPFSPESTLTFCDDKIAEDNDRGHFEVKYSALERMCIDGDRFLYLYYSSMQAILLPVDQLKQQLDYGQWLLQMTQKCPKVERY